MTPAELERRLPKSNVRNGFGFTVVAGAGTELRTVGPLSRGAGPRGAGGGTELRTVGPLSRGAGPRGWYCYQTLRCIWPCRQSWWKHRAKDGWPSEQRRRAARVVLLPDPEVHMAVPPELVEAPS
ncbi:hypothetical protein MRB53_003905 [Persea americana]|uniref:Uncharacterized protein n=1 Tax=Persea americana TaxID=3435 RepID=A0ACC2N287_PERAE|nr:hypothetical protein MRB53_003905 [Persea americana]